MSKFKTLPQRRKGAENCRREMRFLIRFSLRLCASAVKHLNFKLTMMRQYTQC